MLTAHFRGLYQRFQMLALRTNQLSCKAMSISSMTNVAYARRADVEPINEVPTNLREVEAAKAGKSESATPATTALSAMATYIPTEILTLYVAVLAAISEPNAPAASGVNAAANEVPASAWISYCTFLVMTPLVVWMVYAAKVRAAHKPLPLAYREWPVWEMFAATVAYAAWAFALPNNPFTKMSWYNAAISSVVVLVVSTLLGLLAPILQKSLPAKAGSEGGGGGGAAGVAGGGGPAPEQGKAAAAVAAAQ